MAFYGYKDDVDDSYWTPYRSTDNYDFAPAPVQDSSQYSSPYEFGEPELIEYKSSACYTDNSFVTPSELNYSVYTYSEPKIQQYEPIECHSCNYYEYYPNPSEISYSEPKLLQYEPPPYDHYYFASETKFTISYSTVEFNEPDFEEYDPTPYDGGYDPITTYGKPLPPSDSTCYPRSMPQSDSMSMENFSYASIPTPYGKDDDPPTKPANGIKPIIDTKTEPPNGSKPMENEAHVQEDDNITSDGSDVENFEPPETIPSDSPSYGDQNGFEIGIRGDDGYESDRQVPQIPYGSGLEAMDLCESIFGYWPCLAKREQQRRNKCRDVCDQERRMDPWKSAADYLFGSPMVYDYENYHHQQLLAQYENSWPQ